MAQNSCTESAKRRLFRANGAARLLILFRSEIVLKREDNDKKEKKMYPRSCVAAVIIRDENLLVVKKRDEKGVVYSFPTGGQEAGETLVQAVQREVLEEVGCEIVVGPLLWVREYIGKHHENADLEDDVHVVCHLFHCTMSSVSQIFQGMAPDPDQEGVEWLPLQQLTTYRFYPQALISALIELEQGTPSSVPLYVGDVN
jgi:8-oxo-dGTP diphosphatase